MFHIQTRPGMGVTDQPEASQLPLSLLPAHLVQLLFGTGIQSSGRPAIAPKAPYLADGGAGWGPFSLSFSLRLGQDLENVLFSIQHS